MARPHSALGRLTAPSRLSHSWLALALAAAFFVVGCEGLSERFGKKEEDEKPKEERIPVEVAALERGRIEALLRFSTNLEAEAEVQVVSQASRLVTELNVEEGDRVRRGQVLLRLQDDQQKSDEAQIEVQLAKARRELDRQKNLFSRELISEQAFNDAQFEVDRLELALEDARRSLSYTEVRAPISGTVTARMVNLGDNIQLGQHLFDLVDFDTIVARVFVPERELPRLRLEQEARIYASSAGGEARVGTVERISPVVDPRSGTVKVTVAIPRNQGLSPGMYVEVELVVAEEADALLVPKRALVYDDVQSFVYRLVEAEEGTVGAESATTAGDGIQTDEAAADAEAESAVARPAGPTVERLRVRPILEDRERVVPHPDDGLAAGDQLIVAGQAGLKDGAVVRLVAGVREDGSVPGTEPESEAEAETDAESGSADEAAGEGSTP